MSYRDPKTGRWARDPAARTFCKVFVYGTLKIGEGNHFLLKDALFIGVAATRPEFSMTTVGCPFVHPNGRDVIRGEVYEVDDVQLAALDRLEGYVPGRAFNMYDRVEIPVEILGHGNSPGAQVLAFIYVSKPRRGYAHPYNHRDDAGRITWNSSKAEEIYHALEQHD